MTLDFLAVHFTFLGLNLQVWMPIVLAGVAVYLWYLWKRRY